MAELSVFRSLPTFRDPAGSVEVRADGAYRSVYAPFDAEILAFLSLPVASQMVADGRLISSEVLGSQENSDVLMLRHPRVSFPSYPWEWPPTLWLAAAELTLNLCKDLLKEGWVLKDATPLNVLFQGTQPIFIDVLSIERATLDRPLWMAYAQFVRTFLLPMIAHSQLGWPLQVTLSRRDGYEPEEIFKALPWPARFRQPAFSAVTLPSVFSNLGGSKKLSSPTANDPDVARHVILKTLERLLERMRQAAPGTQSSSWSNYVETANHYSDDDHTRKKSFVSEVLDDCSPMRVLDVGCNAGVYSMLAADQGAEVVSIDTDSGAIDRLATNLKDSGMNILPLCIDLAQPTPATGWENRECASFLSRCIGHFDTVMMLAVLHHLLLGNQIPLEGVASLAAELTSHNLILEWVPPTDPKFQEILRGRDDIYAHITEAAFREAFARYFAIVRERTLTNGRILFHFERR
jgi:SAM-dependent methyltransferase